MVGWETCPTTGAKHLQGAAVLNKRLAFSTLKRKPGLTRAHIESMRGTPAQSLAYCTKEDPLAFTHGVLPQPGKRNDLCDAVDLLREGLSIGELIRTADTPIVATFVRYPKGLTQISHTFREYSYRPKPFVLWLHGSTGTGKTRFAHDLSESLGCSSDIWLSNASLQWFDGYHGQKVACWDDYRTNHAKFSFVLRLLDRYKLDVAIKGGFVNWQPLLIIVTTPKSARATWNLRTEEDIAQLERRITLSADFDSYEDSYELQRDRVLKRILDRLNDGDGGEFEQLRDLAGAQGGVASEGSSSQAACVDEGGDGDGGDCIIDVSSGSLRSSRQSGSLHNSGVLGGLGSDGQSDGLVRGLRVSSSSSSSSSDSPPKRRLFLDLSQEDVYDGQGYLQGSGSSEEDIWEERVSVSTSSSDGCIKKVFF